MERLCFEIKDSGDFLRIEPRNLVYPNAESDWDKNWVVAQVSIKGGSFSGKYECGIMTLEFERLKQSISNLYIELDGELKFKDLEGYLDLSIKGDGIGHFEVELIGCDKPGIYGSELKVRMQFDQTQINEMISQLNAIVKEFPIKGNFNIANE